MLKDLIPEGGEAQIADIRDDSPARTGQRLVIVLKPQAVRAGRARRCRTAESPSPVAGTGSD